MSSSHLNSAMSYSNTVDTLSRDTTANMKLATMELAEKVMVIEERTIFLGDLVKMRRGTKKVENYVRKQENIRHESKENRTWEEQEEIILREREIVVKSMENKLSDNIAKGARKGRELCQLKRRLLWRLGRDDERRKFTNKNNQKEGTKRRWSKKIQELMENFEEGGGGTENGKSSSLDKLTGISTLNSKSKSKLSSSPELSRPSYISKFQNWKSCHKNNKKQAGAELCQAHAQVD